MHKATITAVVIIIVFAVSAVVVMDTRTDKKVMVSNKAGTTREAITETNERGDAKRGYIESTPSPTSSPVQDAPSVTASPPPAPAKKAVTPTPPATAPTTVVTKSTVKTESVIPAPKTHTIQMQDYAYQPKQLTIKKGDSITWVNNDMASHTVTSEGGSELASDYLKKGESYTHTFTSSGTFSYYCQPHPYMKAVVVVE